MSTELSEFSRKFTEQLRHWMHDNGVSGRKVASKLGVSPSKVSSRLTGQRPIDTEMLTVAAELGKTSPEELMLILLRGVAEQLTIPSSLQQMIIDEVRKQTDQKINQIKAELNLISNINH